MNDEPQPTKKLKYQKYRVRGTDKVGGMQFNQWRDLIFLHLNLLDLIKLQRLCKRFYFYKVLSNLIRTKRKNAFGGTQKINWNRLGRCSSSVFGRRFGDMNYIKSEHRNKFFHWLPVSGLLAIYPLRSQLFDKLVEHVNHKVKIYRREARWPHPSLFRTISLCSVYIEVGRGVYFHGLNEEHLRMLNQYSDGEYRDGMIYPKK